MKARATYHILRLMLLSYCSVMLSCQPSDDIETIFSTHGWNFTGFCYTPNWDSADCSLLDITLSGFETHQLNTIQFLANGTVEIEMPGCSAMGEWAADGIKRTFVIANLRITSGSLETISPFSKKFYDDLCKSAWYRGDSTYLQLFESESHYYLLFAPKP